jgi:magnesium chelatase family protein
VKTPTLDLSEVRGQSDAINACARAVGMHLAGHPVVLALEGPPGTGKTMIARRLGTLLPAPTEHEQAWIAAEYLGAGMDVAGQERPFRAPHHTISSAALVGEGWKFSHAAGNPCAVCKRAEDRGQPVDRFHQFHTLPRAVVGRAGELDLARHGVLFLDELPEFALATVEAIGYAIRKGSPASRPLLVTAHNPCACGWSGSGVRECTCPAASIERHAARAAKRLGMLGGEIVRVTVPMMTLADMRGVTPGESSASIRARIGVAS